MKVRFLGSHQGESKESRFVSLLIDDFMAVDAGSLAGALSIREQRALQSVLITHHHLDHIKDLPLVCFNRMQVGDPCLAVYATQEVQRVLLDHLMDGVIWPDFTVSPTPENPALCFVAVEEGRPFRVCDYEVLPLRTSHPVPTLGYQISSPEGRKVFFTSDTGPIGHLWERVTPDLLVVEVTFSNDLEDLAIRVGHLTASLLRTELAVFRSIHGYYPRVRAVHVNPFQEEGIRDELAIVAQDLGTEIEMASQDTELFV